MRLKLNLLVWRTLTYVINMKKIIYLLIVLYLSGCTPKNEQSQFLYDCSNNYGIVHNYDSLFYYGKCCNFLSLSCETISKVSYLIRQVKTLKEIKLSECVLLYPTDFFFKISKLPNLVSLSIDFDKCDSIPINFGTLKKLTELDLKIDSTKKLDFTFYKLNNLNELSIETNEFKDDPRFVFLKNIKKLGLTANLKTLPSFILQLENLEQLNLYNNPNLYDLPEELFRMKKLKEITLVYTGIEATSIDKTNDKIEKFKKLNSKINIVTW